MAQCAVLPYFWRPLEILRPLHRLPASWKTFLFTLSCSIRCAPAHPEAHGFSQPFSPFQIQGLASPATSSQCHFVLTSWFLSPSLSPSSYRKSPGSFQGQFLTAFTLSSFSLKTCCLFSSFPWTVVMKRKNCFNFYWEEGIAKEYICPYI